MEDGDRAGLGMEVGCMDEVAWEQEEQNRGDVGCTDGGSDQRHRFGA